MPRNVVGRREDPSDDEEEKRLVAVKPLEEAEEPWPALPPLLEVTEERNDERRCGLIQR